MSVVAKFRVVKAEITSPETSYKRGEETITESHVKVELMPVYADANNPEADPEDINFSIATPSGKIEMNVTNPDAAEQFQMGDEFYVNFERVNKE